MKNKTLDLKKGDTPVRASEALVIEPAKSWERLQQAKDLFVDLEAQTQEHEKFPKVVDGGGGGHPKGKFVYAAFALGLSSTPSTNFTPAITLASNSYPFKRRQCFSATRAN